MCMSVSDTDVAADDDDEHVWYVQTWDLDIVNDRQGALFRLEENARSSCLSPRLFRYIGVTTGVWL